MAEAEAVLARKYPAKAHARRVVEHIRRKRPDANGVIYLEAQKTRLLEDSDQAEPFRQRRFFYYLSGCELPDSYLTYEVHTDRLTLYIPPVDPEDVVWSGLPLSPQDALRKYDVDQVRYSTEVNSALVSLSQPSRSVVWAIARHISDHITFLEFDEKDLSTLKPAVEECRVIKDDYEVALIRRANQISAGSHDAVRKAVARATNERELEAVFAQQCIANGSREQAYHSIVASGENAATLHYVKNDEPLADRWNVLVDAGAEYQCYASDITRTLPIRGKFSQESREIYEIVLRMQEECIDMLREGVQWEDVHMHAHKVAIGGLLKLGILSGPAEEIHEAKTSVAFFPHGLGHYLGLDTHDTGGHPNYADADPYFKYLRVRGKLPAGSVITVEPGIYFCRFIIEPFLADPRHSCHIRTDVLDRYWRVGGVRIEDNVLITKTGYENLTNVPKTTDTIEASTVVDGSSS